MFRQNRFHAHFVHDVVTGEARYWHPAEISVMHGHIHMIFLPQDVLLAWHGLGNKIAVPHAIPALTNAINRFTCDMPTVDEILQDFRKEQINAAEAQLSRKWLLGLQA